MSRTFGLNSRSIPKVLGDDERRRLTSKSSKSEIKFFHFLPCFFLRIPTKGEGGVAKVSDKVDKSFRFFKFLKHAKTIIKMSFRANKPLLKILNFWGQFSET